ncbi:MAG TPA: M24 family metallopeptidase [Gemmatimonadaceae bacterium]|nr:M24 family metallopeptidase [Gemmatimonadaceae bacterium]
MRRPRTRHAAPLLLLLALHAPSLGAQRRATPPRPFGTLREQAALQQRWLDERLRRVLPALLREHGVDLWVVPMREYNEDPVFTSLVAPTTFAARRRTIYVFHDRCAERRTAGQPCAPGDTVDRIALGGTSQGGLYQAMRSVRAAAGPAGANEQAQAELWGDEQWEALRDVIVPRRPRRIAVDVSRVWNFADGLSAGELEGMREALGPDLAARIVHVDALPVDLIATRVPAEDSVFTRMNALAWSIIEQAFSSAVIRPDVTTTEDVVWWMRQRVNDLGLGSWFQPSVTVQRRGTNAQQLGPDPVIRRGDVLHCDFGVTALRLNTDTQHMGYVLRPGEREAPAGLRRALATANRLQDIVVAELRPGRTGNEVLAASRARMREAGIDGTIYSHPIGMHGHGAGPLIGLWDRQEGVPGRGDARARPSTWFSIELQATSPIAEWDGQRVRMGQEEDVIVDASGAVRWAWKRQTALHLVR